MHGGDLTLTLHCDNRCPFCPQAHLEMLFVPSAEVLRHLERIRRTSDSVVLTGGEPTLHPQFFAVLERCRELGFQRVGVITNGRRCSKLAFARKLLAGGVNDVAVSVNSHRAQVQDAMSGVKGAFEETWRGLANLSALNAKSGGRASLRVNFLLGPANVDHADETARRLVGIGVRTIFFLDTISQEAGKDIAPYPKVRRLFEAVSREARFSGVHFRFRGFPGCIFGPLPSGGSREAGFPLPAANGSRIAWEPMAFRTHPKLEESGLDDYLSDMSGQFTKEVSACAGCALRGPCNGVQKAYLRLGGAGVGGACEAA